MSKPNKLNYRGSSKVIAYLANCANWLLDNLSNVIANPSDAATDDLTKIQIGDTVYNVAGGSSTASNVSYDNTTSGLTADDVQEAIDEVQGNVEDMIPLTQKGVASGVAELDSNGKVPSSQLPSYVDDVVEYNSISSFPETGVNGKIYVDLSTNLTYRWSGSEYVEISPSLALGETSATAYRGDRGKTAYDHSQTTGNPHGTTKSDVGLGNVPNVATNDQTPTFTEASTRANIASGETLATIMGKIKKFFTDLKTVAFTGSYTDLTDKPTIPAAQVNSDWNASSGVSQILNKPSLATVATSGSYNDLSNKPTIPTVNNATLTIQKNGTNVQTFTANQSTNATANITVPTKTSDLTNDSNFATTTDVSGKVSKTGDTMSGNLWIEKAGEAYVAVKNNGKAVTIYMDVANDGSHGLWTNGYYSNNAFVSDGKWIIYRKTDGGMRFNGNALTADNAAASSKLATARTISLDGDLIGSVNFDGSSNVSIVAHNYYVGCGNGNTNNYPWHRIARVNVGTAQYQDKFAVLVINASYDTPVFGIVKIAVRTNYTNSSCSCEAYWIVRSGLASDTIKIALWGVSGQNVYADVFFECTKTYARLTVYQLYGDRLFTLTGSSEAQNTTISDKGQSYEVYKTVEDAATEIHNQAYTMIHSGQDVALVDRANAAVKDGSGNVITSTYLPLTGGELLNSSTDTPLIVRSGNSNRAFICFRQSNGTVNGYMYVNESNKAGVYYSNAYHHFALESDLSNYLPLAGGTMTGTIDSMDIKPKASGTYSLGNDSYRFNNVWAGYYKAIARYDLRMGNSSYYSAIQRYSSMTVTYGSASGSSSTGEGMVFGADSYHHGVYGNGIKLYSLLGVETNHAIYNSSDEKIKVFSNDIESDEGKLVQLFDEINICSYKYKYSNYRSLDIGINAQELESSLDKIGIDSDKYNFLNRRFNHFIDRSSEEEDRKFYLSFYSIDYSELHNLSLLKIKHMEKKHKEDMQRMEVRLAALEKILLKEDN